MIVSSTTVVSASHCKRVPAVAAAIAAAAVAVVLVAVVAVAGKCIARCRVFSLRCLVCLSPFLLSHFSSSAPSAELRVSSTLSLSRACSAALLAARHVRRRPRAIRKCGPLSTRIHQAFLHHVTCLFDTSFPSCIEFMSIFSSTHSSCVVISSFPSCSSRASTSPSSFLLLLQSLLRSRLSFSLLLSCHFFLSLFLRSPLLSRLLRSSLFLSRLSEPSFILPLTPFLLWIFRLRVLHTIDSIVIL